MNHSKKGYLAAACILGAAAIFIIYLMADSNLPLLPPYLILMYSVSKKLQGGYLQVIYVICSAFAAAGDAINMAAGEYSQYTYYLVADLAIPFIFYRTLVNSRQYKYDRNKAEEALRTALEETSNELENFTYIASHDLQEPLRMVSAYTELLERKYGSILDDTGRQYLSYAGEAARRMQSQIRDLLHYTKISSREEVYEETDLHSLICSVIEIMKPMVKESSAQINIGRLPVITADPVLIKILFQHLICNAIKFRGNKQPEIFIESEEAENEWLFMVKDNGMGISPEYFEKIFVVFQRLHTRDKFSGSGMGLPICRRIVEHHGGKIWVESNEGDGSKFYFTISKLQGSLKKLPPLIVQQTL